MADVWLSNWKNTALRRSTELILPLTKFQSHVLRLLAAGRSPDSYVAGGIVINEDGPRYSADIDIFQDSAQRLETAAEADAKALIDAGLTVIWRKIQTAKRDAEVIGADDAMRLEWVHDSAFRFFPTQHHELFGYVLHPVDLATNKASASADRREPRDIIDLLTIHETILPLGAVICLPILYGIVASQRTNFTRWRPSNLSISQTSTDGFTQ